DQLPLVAAIHTLPQAARRSGINNVRALRVLLQHARAHGRVRQSQNALEQLRLVLALVHAGAGAGIDRLRAAGIDDDAEHVGVEGDSLADAAPAGAAVIGLPRQVPGAGVDDVRVLRIDGYRLDVLDLSLVLGRDALPCRAAVARAEDSVDGADHQRPWIARRHRHGADRFAMHSWQRTPATSAIVGAEDVAFVGVVQTPRRYVDRR